MSSQTETDLHLRRTLTLFFLAIHHAFLQLLNMVALTWLQVLPTPCLSSLTTRMPPLLEEAQDVHLTAEEGTTYLKNVLGVKCNTTDGTYIKTPNGDAQGVSKTNEENWIPVIRHRCMQVKTKQGPPTVGFGGRAGQSWRPHPGLYNANLRKKFPVTTDTTEQRNKTKRPQRATRTTRNLSTVITRWSKQVDTQMDIPRKVCHTS